MDREYISIDRQGYSPSSYRRPSRSPQYHQRQSGLLYTPPRYLQSFIEASSGGRWRSRSRTLSQHRQPFGEASSRGRPQMRSRTQPQYHQPRSRPPTRYHQRFEEPSHGRRRFRSRTPTRYQQRQPRSPRSPQNHTQPRFRRPSLHQPQQQRQIPTAQAPSPNTKPRPSGKNKPSWSSIMRVKTRKREVAFIAARAWIFNAGNTAAATEVEAVNCANIAALAWTFRDKEAAAAAEG